MSQQNYVEWWEVTEVILGMTCVSRVHASELPKRKAEAEKWGYKFEYEPAKWATYEEYLASLEALKSLGE